MEKALCPLGEARLDWEVGPWLAAGMVLLVLLYTLSKASLDGFAGLFCKRRVQD